MNRFATNWDRKATIQRFDETNEYKPLAVFRFELLSYAIPQKRLLLETNKQTNKQTIKFV